MLTPFHASSKSLKYSKKITKVWNPTKFEGNVFYFKEK